MSTVYGQNPHSRRPEQRLARLASKQHGVIARAQALSAGLTKGSIQWRIEAALWLPVYAGIYRLATAPETWHQAMIAACLAFGPDALASHGAAGRLWRLVGFEEAAVELTVPRERDRLRGSIRIHKMGPLNAADRAEIDRIPVTGIARTLIDLAAVTPRNRVEEALDDALTRGLVTPEKIRKRLDTLGRRRGTAVMRALIDARDPAMGIPRHVFETRFLRIVKRARIPEPHRNYDIHDRGRFIANVDFAWPDEKVGIEADSYRWHADLPTWEKDRWKDHELVLLGWKIRRVTWGDLRHNADDVTDWIRRARAPAGK